MEPVAEQLPLDKLTAELTKDGFFATPTMATMRYMCSMPAIHRR